jgi:hypothetical protein
VGLSNSPCNGALTFRGAVKAIPPTYSGIESYLFLLRGGVTRG